MIYEEHIDGFIISTDKSLLNIGMIHRYLSTESYWSKNISLDIVQKSITGSVCFGIYQQNSSSGVAGNQIGFARVITDMATFGYLADVFILPEFRGKGLSKWMMKSILAHPELQHFRSWMLGTKDAHGLYEQFGFVRVGNSERIMRLPLMSEYPATQDKPE